MTPDGQRTMNTFLGACQNLSEADVDEDLVKQSAIVYLEGYIWDPPAAKAALAKAAKIARAAGPPGCFNLVRFFLRRPLPR